MLRIRKFLLRNVVFVAVAVIGAGYLVAFKTGIGLALWTFIAALGVLVVLVWGGELW